MSRGLGPDSEAVHKAVLWISEQRLENPHAHLPDLLDDAGLRFDLTPIEQESLRTILTLVPTDS